MRFRAVGLAAVALSLGVAGAARADADPASDVLYTKPLFLPYGDKVSPAAEAALLAAIRRSVASGNEIRVALISAPSDLGGVPQLFGRPSEYARFLGQELQFVYPGRLLVVMPQGAGYAKGGRLVADRTVVEARPGPGGDGLAQTATELVGVLSGSAPRAAGAGGGGGGSGKPIVLSLLVTGLSILVVVALVVVVRVRRR